jgi:lambda repressor-like predicted transcriptional regulator
MRNDLIPGMMELELSAIWTDLGNGESLTRIAEKCRISHQRLARILIRDDPKKYARIMKNRSRFNKKTLLEDLDAIWTELESGIFLTRAALKHRISRSTLADALRRNDARRYSKIMRTLAPNVKKYLDVNRAWTDLSDGLTLEQVARKNSMCRQTLTKYLRLDNQEKYAQRPKLHHQRLDLLARRLRALSKVNPQLLKEFEDGNSLGELSRKHGVFKRTLQRRLIAIYGDRYTDLINARSFGFGSRTGLADSGLEAGILRLLKENGVRFTFHGKLVAEGHRYIPDFLVGGKTIIEVTGMTTRRYWEHNSLKLKRYIGEGYRTILVIERRKLKSVEHYLPKTGRHFVVIEYEDFRANPRKNLAGLCSN